MERASGVLRRDWWVLVVLVVCFVGTVKRGEQAHYADPTIWAGLLAVLAVVPLFWRERRPELTVLGTAAPVTAYFAAGFAEGPIYLPVLLSMFALASRRTPREALPYAGLALLTIVLGLVVRELRTDAHGTWAMVGWTSWFVTIASASGAAGSALRSRRQTQAEQIRRTATEEQLRMAQDLHDGVGHGLAVIAMQAGVALHVLDQDPAAARRSLEAIRETSRESLDSLRAELVRLAPTTGRPAPRSPRNGLADLPVLAARIGAGGVQVDLEVAVDPGVLPVEVDAVGYTVVQEALTNVLRHAGASLARVAVRRLERDLEIVVADDGRAAPAGDEGLGILGMRSRVEALGGSLEAGPAGHGWTVRALLPVEESR